MRDLVAIALFGALGSVGRYTVSSMTHRALGTEFPYGTFVVNVLGCFLLGLLMQTSVTTPVIPPAWRHAIAVGLLGGFTTFSTFSYETVRHAMQGQWSLAAANIGANVLLGGLATWLGIGAGRALA